MRKIYQRTVIKRIEVWDQNEDGFPGEKKHKYSVRDPKTGKVIDLFKKKSDLDEWLKRWGYIEQV